jgi:lysozyme
MTRKINKEGVDLIKRWEGLKLIAYLCPANVWTIGYGHTATVRKGQEITEARAEELLRMDLDKFEKGIERLITVPLNDNQFAALVSWAFNVGLGAAERSTLRRMLNAGSYHEVPAQLRRWNKAGGVVLKGLTNRREDEVRLWNKQATVETPDLPEQIDTTATVIKVIKWFSRLFSALRKS